MSWDASNLDTIVSPPHNTAATGLVILRSSSNMPSIVGMLNSLHLLDGLAGRQAAVAIMKAWLTSDEAAGLVVNVFQDILGCIKSELSNPNACSKSRLNILISALAPCIAEDRELLQTLWTDLAVPVLDEKENYLAHSHMLGLLQKLFSVDAHREYLSQEILEGCATRFDKQTRGSEEHTPVSLGKWAEVVEVYFQFTADGSQEAYISQTQIDNFTEVLAQMLHINKIKISRVALRLLSSESVSFMMNDKLRKEVWRTIEASWREGSAEKKGFVYAIMTHFVKSFEAIWENKICWDIIVDGLNGSDTLITKRSYHILRQVVGAALTADEWRMGTSDDTSQSADATKRVKHKKDVKGFNQHLSALQTWELRFNVFGNVFETLDGCQSNLVQEVWSQVAHITRRAKYPSSQWPLSCMRCDDRFVGILIRKAFLNPNPAIKNWVAMEFLKNPPCKDSHWIVPPNVVSHSLVHAIKTMNFYRRYADSIHEPLLKFLHSYILNLNGDSQRAAFLKDYVTNVCKISKNDHSMVAEMQIFSHLIKQNLIVPGAIGKAEIRCLQWNMTQKCLGSELSRSLLTDCSIDAIVAFSNPSDVPLEIYGSFFVSVRGSSLDPGTRSHDKLQAWVKSPAWENDSNENLFKRELRNAFQKVVEPKTPFKGLFADLRKLAFFLSLVESHEEKLQIFEPVLDVLRSCYTRSYIPKEILERSFELFVMATGVLSVISLASVNGVQMLNIAIGERGIDEMAQVLEHEVNSLWGRSTAAPKQTAEERTMRFSSQAMGKLLQVCNDAKLHLRVINLLVESAKQIKQLSGVQQLYAIEVLDYAMVQILHPSKRKLFIHTSGFSDSMESLVLEVCNLKCNARCANCETPDNIADFFIHQWNTLSTIYACAYTSTDDSWALLRNTDLAELVFNKATEALDSASNNHLSPVLETLVCLFPPWYNYITKKIGKSTHFFAILSEILQTAWSAYTEVDPNSLTEPLLESFVQLFFNEDLATNLELHTSDDVNAVKTRELFTKCMEYMKGSQANERLVHALAKQVFRVLGTSPSGAQVALCYVQELCSLILFEAPLNQFLHQGEKEAIKNDTANNGILKYSLLQAEALAFFDHLASRHEFAEFHEKLVLHLLEHNFHEDRVTSTYRPSSSEHAIKLRIWQALCVLARTATKSNCESILSLAVRGLEENHLPSIRYYIELFVARCLMCDLELLLPKFILSILKRFNVRSPTIVSVLYVLVHVSPKLVRELSSCYDELIKDIIFTTLPWMCCPGSQARALTQYLVSSLLQKESVNKFLGSGVLGDRSLILTLQNYIEKNSDMRKMLKRITKNLSTLDATKFCSFEGVMSGQLNMWGNIFPDDILEILKSTITEVNKEVALEDQYRYTWMQSTALNSQKPMTKQQRTAAASSAFTKSMYIQTSGAGERLIRPFEFQRKLLPWGNVDDLMVSEHTEAKQLTREDHYSSRPRQEIIVIATLVDKTPNLAGLARTCEIFGATKLVIPSKKYQDEELFESISVTAEKWLPIDYVPEIELRNYLNSVRTDGYTLVGLEQTSQSKQIQSYVFPRKLAILLGKEQEGIPAEFIDMLDECIEIPQFGIIRSLNVHVSGSILLWEYTRQGLRQQQQQPL